MNIYYQVHRLKCNRREKKGFICNRPNGTDDYLLLHFKTPVRIWQDDEIISAAPDACIVMTPGSRHWFESRDCDLVHNWVHFMPDDPDTFLRLGFPVNKLFYPMKTDFITMLMKECQDEFINRKAYWENALSASLSRLFILLARESLQSEKFPQSKYMSEVRDKLGHLRIELYHSPERAFSVAEMAQKLSMSRSRFSVLYRECFGVSPREDAIHARITYAKYLLDAGDLKIEKIAEMTGYKNLYHFIRQFKDLTGVTPGKYRIR